ncbi:uncharacterized protein CLUP02_09831 [Colletotrichum lupini]|uniref:Uncharacterized protein n=1 Tax=Colletotrichum lupini TaxID=145971 RepID=A0A9Q8WIZ2_9PEZI|nr:uncharacterized protein CLUP02_09831 [Colletotrichum lupini]UQC84335.1 hypothetical protein CLUP02_09831 [Colletotrichum lupini]
MRTDLSLHCVGARRMSGDKPQESLENGQDQWARKGEGAPPPGMFPHSDVLGTYCVHLPSFHLSPLSSSPVVLTSAPMDHLTFYCGHQVQQQTSNTTPSTSDAKHHQAKGLAKWQQAGSEVIIDVTTAQTHGTRRLQRRTKAGALIVQDQKSLTTPNPIRISQSSPLSSSVTGVRCAGKKPRYQKPAFAFRTEPVTLSFQQVSLHHILAIRYFGTPRACSLWPLADGRLLLLPAVAVLALALYPTNTFHSQSAEAHLEVDPRFPIRLTLTAQLLCNSLGGILPRSSFGCKFRALRIHTADIIHVFPPPFLDFAQSDLSSPPKFAHPDHGTGTQSTWKLDTNEPYEYPVRHAVSLFKWGRVAFKFAAYCLI